MNDFAPTTRRYVSGDTTPMGVRRSFAVTSRKFAAPSGTGRPMKYGDRLHVRLTRVQAGGAVLADFFLNEVNDMSEVYGELRHYTRGQCGLTTLCVRNVTRGWAFTQPFMLYADTHRPAMSVARPYMQPAKITRTVQAPAF